MKFLLNSLLVLAPLILESEAKNIPTGQVCTEDVYKGLCMKTDCCGYATPVEGGLASRICNTQGATNYKNELTGVKYVFTCPFKVADKKIAGTGSTYIQVSKLVSALIATSYFMS